MDKPPKPLTNKDFLSTGSTLLNLACTGRSTGGFAKGHFFLVVGDSVSGKTFLTLTCFAEAMRNENFKDFRLIHDNPEQGALMDIAKLFGSKVAKRMEPASSSDLGFSRTIEEFYYNLDDAFKKGDPFIYVLDSHDALDSDQAEEKFQEQKTASRKGKQSAGSFGDGKAKYNSQNLRRVVSKLKKTGSILIIISQTRDSLGFGFNPKTRAGGRALRFYSTLELWSSVKEKLKQKGRQVGVLCQIEVKKNRFTGKERKVIVPIYNGVGIDDIGSCVDFLVAEKKWPEHNKTIHANDFAAAMKREKLIGYIEEQELEKRLRILVKEVWNQIEESLTIRRKQRYQ